MSIAFGALKVTNGIALALSVAGAIQMVFGVPELPVVILARCFAWPPRKRWNFTES